jgi:hypothetical protein
MDPIARNSGRSRMQRLNDWIALREPLIRLIYRILIILGLATVAWELYGTDQDNQDENENVESVDAIAQPDWIIPDLSPMSASLRTSKPNC